MHRHPGILQAVARRALFWSPMPSRCLFSFCWLCTCPIRGFLTAVVFLPRECMMGTLTDA